MIAKGLTYFFWNYFHNLINEKNEAIQKVLDPVIREYFDFLDNHTLILTDVEILQESYARIF